MIIHLFVTDAKRFIDLARVSVFAVAIGSVVAAAEAQPALQLRPHAAWDGLGSDPQSPRSPPTVTSRRSAGQKLDSPSNTTIKQADPPTSTDPGATPRFLEEAARQDEENRQLKRATDICRGC